LHRKATFYSKVAFSSDRIQAEDVVNFKNFQGKMLLYILYRREPKIFRALNARANLAVSRGFKIIPKNDKQKKIVKNFLSKLHPTDPVTYLVDMFRRLSIDTDWSGTGFWEKIYSKNAELIGFDIVHPLHMDFKRDTRGNIIFFGNLPYAWHQKVDNRERDVELHRIASLKYNLVGDEFLGMSTIEPMFNSSHRLLNIEEGIAQGVFRHGTPLHDITVGDESHSPNPEMLDAASQEVKGIGYMTEYIHPPWYRVQLIESFSLGKASKYVDPFIDNLVAATGIPRFIILGKGESTNKAVATQILRAINMTIEPLQQKLKLFFEKEILLPLMDFYGEKSCPFIQWNEILPEEQSDPIKKLDLLTKMAVGGKPLITWNEAREIAKLPSGKKNQFEELTQKSKDKSETSNISSGKQGIYLTPPHGRLIQEGDKRAILTSKKYSNIVGKHLILISDAENGEGNAYGIIKLSDPETISWNEFKDYAMLHRVSFDEAKKWWPNAEFLYFYNIRPVKFYDSLKRVNVPKGVQKFIKNVEFLES
jgi:hypothetical protein